MIVELTLGGILWWIGAFVLFDLIISTLLLIGLGFGASSVKGNLNVTP